MIARKCTLTPKCVLRDGHADRCAVLDPAFEQELAVELSGHWTRGSVLRWAVISLALVGVATGIKALVLAWPDPKLSTCVFLMINGGLGLAWYKRWLP